MKCHYEVLGIPRNATDDEIKKAYRKLALRWHPDKNLDNTELAKEQFQLLQQAWEILSDPHERSWYDNHREAILKGGLGEDYIDDSIDIFQYFTTTCFKGYGDDEKGFYTIYRKVFERLATEDAEFVKEMDSDTEAPGFGDSMSSYEDVHNFYAYWQSYSTKRSFAWLDPHDIREGPSRRIVRLIEKENKKVRERAKKERNEQVRNLVSFVRKRDKRVQAHVAKLAEQAKENMRKAEERKRQQVLERQKQLKEHKQSEWSKFANIEAELKNIEANLDREFGEDSSSNEDMNDENMLDSNSLYCVACNKIFKTQKSFTNHERSKKHKDNVAVLRDLMIKENEKLESSDDNEPNSEEGSNNEQNLATDSQMPDFLLNYAKNDINNPNIKKETSDEEVMSDDEDSDQPSKIKSKEKHYPEGTKLATGPDMDDFFKSPKISQDNNHTTSSDELLSDQEDDEIVQPKKQKNKKKRKKNVQNILADALSDEDTSINEDILLSKKQRKKQHQKKALLSKMVENDHQSFSDTVEECAKESLRKEDKVKDRKVYREGTTVIMGQQTDDESHTASKISENEDDITSDDELTSDPKDKDTIKNQKKKVKRRKNFVNQGLETINNGDTNKSEDIPSSRNQQRKASANKVVNDKSQSNDNDTEQPGEEVECLNIKSKSVKKSLEKQNEAKNNKESRMSKVSDLTHCCVTCKAEFPSKNKLFEHLKKTGHSVYIPNSMKSKKAQEKPSKSKKGSNRRNQ